MVGHVGDIQVVSVNSRSNVTEVQSLTISALAGSLRGNFTISWGYHKSHRLPHNASADEVASAVKELGDVGAVNVLRDKFYSGLRAGFRWNVTFPNYNGDLANLNINTTGLTGLSVRTTTQEIVKGVACEVQTISVEGARGGSFRLRFNGATTSQIPYNASAAEVKSALEGLSTINEVVVTLNTSATYGAGRMWTVMFTDNTGDLPLMDGDASGLTPLPGYPPDRPRLRITEAQPGTGKSIGGSFLINFDVWGNGTYKYDKFRYNESAQSAQTKLRALGGTLGNAVITRSSYGFNGGYSWSVTFASMTGSQSLLWASTSGFTGTLPYVSVYKVRNGTTSEVQKIRTYLSGGGTIKGSFFLSYKGHETGNLSYSASASQIKTALESLPTMGGVKVSRSSMGSGCYMWLISFYSPLTDGPQDLLYAGGVDNAGQLSSLYSASSGGIVHINVTRVVAGSYMVPQGNMSFSFRGTNISVPLDASAELLSSLLEPAGTGALNISRSARSPLGYENHQWNITFAELAGDVPDIVVDASSLVSNGSVTVQSTIVRQSGTSCCLGGYFGLTNGVVATGPIPVSVNASALQSILITTFGLEVEVIHESRVNNGSNWLINFNDSSLLTSPKIQIDRNSTNITVAGVPSLSAEASISQVQGVQVPNVQTILLQADTALGGHFQVGYNGSLTPKLPYDISVDSLKKAMEQYLFEVVDISLNVTRWPGNSKAWDITFLSVAGQMNKLTCIGSFVGGFTGDTKCVIYVKQSATSRKLGGTFTLNFAGWNTTALSRSASAYDVQAALMALPSVGTLNVSRSGMDGTGGYQWAVTFLSPPSSPVQNIGDVSTIIGYSALTGTAPRIHTQEAVQGSYLSGSFTLSFANLTTRSLSYDVSEEELSIAIKSILGASTDLDVQRTTLTDRLGYQWAVSFASIIGDVGLMIADSSSLSGTDVVATVYEETAGQDPTGGRFALGFLDEQTSLLAHNVSDSEMELALESLSGIGDLVVTREDHEDDDGYTWLITFTTLGEPSNIGTQPQMFIADSRLTGSNVSLIVEKITSACCTVELTFNGQDFTNEGIPFRFDDQPLVLSVYPAFGPVSGGTAVLLSGTGFPSGPYVTCDFGGKAVSASWINQHEISCITPPHPASRVAVTVQSMALNTSSKTISDTAAAFIFHPTIELLELSPIYVNVEGGTYLNITGSGFLNMSSLLCAFESWAPTNASANGTIYGYTTVEARLISSSSCSCPVPSYLSLFGSEVQPFLDESVNDHGRIEPTDAYLYISNNGMDFSTSLRFRYSALPVVSSIFPVRGSRLGGSQVTVRGSGFQKDADITCAFGSKTVPAEYLTSEAIECISPSHFNVPSIQQISLVSAGFTPEIQIVELVIPQQCLKRVGGGFAILLESYKTSTIPYNASAGQMQMSLEALANVGQVQVNRSIVFSSLGQDFQGQVIAWAVTFQTREGDIPQLSAYDESLSGLTCGVTISSHTLQNGSTGPAIHEIQKVLVSRDPAHSEIQKIKIYQFSNCGEILKIRVASASRISGTYYLSCHASSSPFLTVNATADQVKAALQVRHLKIFFYFSQFLLLHNSMFFF